MGCHNSRLVGYAVPITEPRPLVVNQFNSLTQPCVAPLLPLPRPCLNTLPLANGLPFNTFF